MNNWRSIKVPTTELRLDITLACGQSFRWKENSAGEWTSVLAGRVWTLKQTSDELLYKVHEKNSLVPFSSNHGNRNSTAKASNRKSTKSSDSITTEYSSEHNTQVNQNTEDETILRDYFQLQIHLEDLYKTWSSVDTNFKSVATSFQGVRMLRQDPVENLFSFICSSNNNIPRISSMVEKLCANYGEKISELNGQDYYAFPSVKSLAGNGVEAKLRELGFGYRAKFISESAKYIVDNHDDRWLYSLRNKPYPEAKAELVKLCGVGAKVADCVCLMSLDKPGAIPVDTHVWQIAHRDYMPKLKTNKTLTDSIYKEIGDFFRDLWGEYAGWAHSVLFSADLKKFQEPKDNQKKHAKRSSSEVRQQKKKLKTRK